MLLWTCLLRGLGLLCEIPAWEKGFINTNLPHPTQLRIHPVHRQPGGSRESSLRPQFRHWASLVELEPVAARLALGGTVPAATFWGFFASGGWEMLRTVQKKTGGPLGSCLLCRHRNPSGSAVPGRLKAPFSASGACPSAPANVMDTNGGQVSPKFPINK